MTLGINQPYYLPYMGLFDRVALCDKFVINTYSKLSRKRYHRRVKIIQIHPGASQEYIYLTQRIPARYEDGTAFCDIKLDDDFWLTQETHAETLYRTYNKAPHFNYASGILDLMKDRSATSLGDYNFRLIFHIAERLGLDSKLINLKDTGFDGSRFNSEIPKGFHDSANYHNYLICKHLNADTMMTGQNGPSWVKEGIFLKKGVKIKYQTVRLNSYRQYSPKGNFVGGLSTLDLLFNCGQDAKGIVGNSSRVLATLR